MSSRTSTDRPRRGRWWTLPATVGIAAASVAGACGDDGEAGDTTGAGATSSAASELTTSPGAARVVEHAAGSTEIPSDVSRIVTVDEYATLLALELGVEPVAALAGYQAQSLGQLITDAGLTQTPHRYTEPNYEAVAATRPDLIVATASTDSATLFDGYSDVAPTVIIPYIAPWTEQLDIAATALGRPERAASIHARIQARIDDLSERLTANDTADQTVSIIGAFADSLYAVPRSTTIGQLLAEVGVARPANQDVDIPVEQGGGYVYFSAETLLDFDADIVLVQGGGLYPTEPITTNPLYDQLTGTVHIIDGEHWNGAGPFAAWWILDDLAAVLFDDGQVATTDDIDSRWTSFLEP